MHLIDEIFARTDLMYLSDMPYEKNYLSVLRAVWDMPEQDYPPNEWNDAYVYLARTKQLSNQAISKEELMRFLVGLHKSA